MWLSPVLSTVSKIAARIYYRFSVAGPVVPRTGPVLLVANHPNSLLDPVLVAAAAGRRVRFLAKAPLFTDRKVRFLVRGSGAIPVYRKVDDPTAMTGNKDMFRAVFDALCNGDAVALFPEGISHSQPSLAPLKTGAARIALGSVDQNGSRFPIIPVGLVLRQKGVFRSHATALIGDPVAWDDLAKRGQNDRDAVRELTARIDDALRSVTVNLEDAADKPLLTCAAQVWEAVFEQDGRATGEVEKLRAATETLARVRAAERSDWNEIVAQLAEHSRKLNALQLAPSDLSTDSRVRTAVRWAAGRFYLIGLPSLVIAIAGYLLFLVPFQVTGMVVGRSGADPDQVSTWKLLVGIPVYAIWILLLTAVATVVWNPMAGVITVALLPAIGLVGLWIRERWRDSIAQARTFLFVRSRRKIVQSLRESQIKLADGLKRLVETAN